MHQDVVAVLRKNAVAISETQFLDLEIAEDMIKSKNEIFPMFITNVYQQNYLK